MNGIQMKSAKFREDYDGKWVYSVDKESFTSGPHPTKEAAMLAASGEFRGNEKYDTFYVAQVDTIYPKTLINPKAILDDIQERAADLGEHAASRLEPTKFIEERLSIVLSAFLDENYIFDFYSVMNITPVSNKLG